MDGVRPKVSIVVPIYRVEKYLSQCVDSLLNQTLEQIEIILVDDGSPDSCGAIADAYAQKDSRIKVIHQSNAGLGPARNTGMQAAAGTYIGFVDSDDWVRPEMYQRLYETAVRHDADIVVSGHCDVCGEEVVVSKAHPLGGTCLKQREDIFRVRKNLYGHAPWDTDVESFPMSVCMSIYRNDMLREEGLCFQNMLSEDTIFNLGAYGCAKVIAFTKDTDYCYRKENQASITATFSEKKLAQFQQFLTCL
ncbi:MAG: glycosyltransferase, partial [Oscillospiraceae bacterium]|nr:glycosyltransferase [Oscillospiraceae bacterium]